MRFKDGTAEAIDTIVFATGYRPVVPFMEESLIFTADGKPRLLVNVVHPEHEGLFAAGLAQANGSMSPVCRLSGPDDRQPNRRRTAQARDGPAGFATLWRRPGKARASAASSPPTAIAWK